MLLVHNGADIDARDSLGKTPLPHKVDDFVVEALLVLYEINRGHKSPMRHVRIAQKVRV